MLAPPAAVAVSVLRWLRRRRPLRGRPAFRYRHPKFWRGRLTTFAIRITVLSLDFIALHERMKVYSEVRACLLANYSENSVAISVPLCPIPPLGVVCNRTRSSQNHLPRNTHFRAQLLNAATVFFVIRPFSIGRF